MLRYLLLSLCTIIIDAKHFDGGTIRWIPVNPYDNSTSIAITIIQSYWWSYPTITCAPDVPISTSGRSTQNTNLICVTDCSTDGGYSTKPINILTDCTSVSSSLGILTSQRSVNITLNAGAHFYLAQVGSAWAALNYPVQSGLQWSILTFIDLRLRPDGFINTPPVANVISPQYVIVNQTTQIQIPVSDVNTGDDVRCRWSKYITGYRRRRRSNEEERTRQEYAASLYKTVIKNGEIIHIRRKRSCNGCTSSCAQNCLCSCSTCDSTTCTGSKCTLSAGCTAGSTTTMTTTIVTTTGATITVSTTTIDTPGTLMSTSSYPNQQPIDECGGICYPGSLPSGTILSNCTISFTGLTAGVWYGAAIQVEDFIGSTSTTPLSSVPVQFLIYVLPQPTCSLAPIILPLTDCLEATVGVAKSFNLSVFNLCDPTITDIADIIISQGMAGVQMSNLMISSTNSSLVYGTFTWTPQANQIGPQQLCVIAYTSEQVQSTQYCVVFTVITSLNACATTMTSTTTTSPTSSITTASPTSSITTASPTSSITTASPTSSITTASPTSSITTASPTSSITTASPTSSITTASSLSSAMITPLVLIFTLPSPISTVTISTSTIGTTSGSTVANMISSMAATQTTESIAKDTSNKALYWGLIAGLSTLGLLLLLALCCCCCLYYCYWYPGAKRRRHEQEKEEEDDDDDGESCQQRYTSSSTESIQTIPSYRSESIEIGIPKKSYQAYNNVLTSNSTTPTYKIIRNNVATSTNSRWPLRRVPVRFT